MNEAEARAAGIQAHDKQGLDANWKVDVWKNIGWHWALIKGPWCVHPYIYDGQLHSYSAMLCRDHPGGIWVGSGATVPEACTVALREADVEIDWRTRLVIYGRATQP